MLDEVLTGRKDNIAAFHADVVHELQKWPLIMEIPEHVRKKDE